MEQREEYYIMECLLLPEGKYIEIVIFRNGHRSLFEHGRKLALRYRTVSPGLQLISIGPTGTGSGIFRLITT